MKSIWTTSVVALALLTGCSVPAGLRITPPGEGPLVVVDWDAEPLPEIPFPNDLATRVDPTSPTGLRLNFSEESSTEAETRARKLVNRMTGFGIYAPISVRFDKRLDLADILARHPDDYDTSDDAIYVVNVDPDSPEFGEAVELDIGHGRFPGDLFNASAYFANDPREGIPSLLFEGVDEDVNGNGVLDPGEDTDSDGVLDKPNVWPPGGDPREDLLTWYELETDTLIVRPIVPMREETTYAVVLTERLKDLDGNPVRSPWPFVHHTRQLEALRPLEDVLPELGVSMTEVAYTWTFTTGRITGDLVDVRQGLRGSGPFGWLAEEFPPTLGAPAVVHELPDNDNPHAIPIDRLVSVLNSLSLFPARSADALSDFYGYAEHLVGASFVTPNLLVDRDDGGDGDRTDEVWELDARTGQAVVGPERVPFTCVTPKRSEGFEPPYDVAFFGHGYGSSRFDFLGFAWAMNRVGWAACANDFPSHGPTVSQADYEKYSEVLEATGFLPFMDHLFDARYQDLDNDGEGDSGADQWISDGFHTADMVRQAVVDWSQMLRVLEQCGEADWGHDLNGDGVNEVTCDWDADGVPDIGGPNARYALLGGSLGGINAAVAAAVEPVFESVGPIVPGGGFMDIGWRSALSGVRQAVAGRVMSPFLLGTPGEDGYVVSQLVMSGRRDKHRTLATLPGWPEGGQLRVENLRNGEVREATIAPDGKVRVGIPANAMDGWEKRIAGGMPRSGKPEPFTTYTVPDNEGVGDRLRLTFLNADGSEYAVVDTFEQEVFHEGLTHPVGSPLIALSEGLGHLRATPRLRRVVNVLALVTEAGDPISYAPYYRARDPLPSMGRPANVMLVPTVGDEIVCVATGIALARAAEVYDRHREDPRYGMSVDRWLIERDVVRGDERFGPWADRFGNKVLFDADNLDDFSDGFSAPSDAPLRVSRPTENGLVGLRIPYVSDRGSHGMQFPDPSKDFDIDTFSVLQIAWFLESGGTEIIDDHCLETASCDFLRDLDGGAK